MSITKHEELKDDPSLQDVKDWSSSFAQKLAESFLGHRRAGVMVVVSVLYEVLAKVMQDECQESLVELLHSGELGEEESLKLAKIMAGLATGRPVEFPDMSEAYKMSDAFGSCLAQVAMTKSHVDAIVEVNRLKLMLASTLLSSDEKANCLDELGSVFGYDEMTSEEKRDMRNHLKGGRLDPVEKPSDGDVDDACNKLFG